MPNVKKLMDKLDELITYLEENDEFRVHQHVNQFYYMEKKAELNLLLAQHEDLNERLERTNQWLETKYQEVFRRWQADRRWINGYEIPGA